MGDGPLVDVKESWPSFLTKAEDMVKEVQEKTSLPQCDEPGLSMEAVKAMKSSLKKGIEKVLDQCVELK